jgi:hypothetical protein
MQASSLMPTALFSSLPRFIFYVHAGRSCHVYVALQG